MFLDINFSQFLEQNSLVSIYIARIHFFGELLHHFNELLFTKFLLLHLHSVFRVALVCIEVFTFDLLIKICEVY